MASVSSLLGMDRTALTAALKQLERRGQDQASRIPIGAPRGSSDRRCHSGVFALPQFLRCCLRNDGDSRVRAADSEANR